MLHVNKTGYTVRVGLSLKSNELALINVKVTERDAKFGGSG